ncbi:MAG: hypothetical protein JWO05_966 [Gemmatimonadetes bacterium]|nr:hypothetical protein [Gemmatimonadota bacterium]
MKAIPGTNITIFLLFFGLAALEAVQSRNWIRVALWAALALVFLRADGLKLR